MVFSLSSCLIKPAARVCRTGLPHGEVGRDRVAQYGGVPLRPPVSPEPLEPVVPLEPLEPLEPVEPVAPLEPLEPVAPLEPLEPVADESDDVLPLLSLCRPQAAREAARRAPNSSFWMG